MVVRLDVVLVVWRGCWSAEWKVEYSGLHWVGSLAVQWVPRRVGGMVGLRVSC
jgi:hypothetical protein